MEQRDVKDYWSSTINCFSLRYVEAVRRCTTPSADNMRPRQSCGVVKLRRRQVAHWAQRLSIPPRLLHFVRYTLFELRGEARKGYSWMVVFFYFLCKV